jgi:predicted nuclease of predicted toxin-antitoxin system
MGNKRLVWIDAQLPPSLAQWLRSEYGTNAMHVETLGLHRAHDSQIFAAARAAEDPVMIVTKDDDFAKLLDQRGPPPQVVWVRCGNVSNQELRRIVLDAWPRALALLTTGEALVEIRRRSEPADNASSSSKA